MVRRAMHEQRDEATETYRGAGRMGQTSVDSQESTLHFDVRWFNWREVRAALAYGRAGGIALHRFRHDLRRFGFGEAEPACHMLSADRTCLIAFGARFDLRPAWIEPPRPRRPDIWHFDVFGPLLAELEAAYPPQPATVAPDLRSTTRQDVSGRTFLA